jgi:phosphatidylglycerophosphate synthase
MLIKYRVNQKKRAVLIIMSKLHSDDENPVDHVLLKGCDYLLPYFKKLNFTPNGLTTLSNIFSIMGIYSFTQNLPIQFYVFIWLGYFFDCMDGHYARTYKMTSKFGDYYDHISDVFLLLVFAYFVYKYYGKYFTLSTLSGQVFILSSLIVLYLMGKHIGCQEKIHEENGDDLEQSHSLAILKNLCPNEADVKWTRYFGIGSGFLYFYTAALILMLYFPR